MPDLSPLSPSDRTAEERRPWGRRLLIAAVVPGASVVLFVLTICGLSGVGLLRPYSIPTGGMAPAVERGDRIYTEGLTYLTRKPRRGEIIVFKTDEIPGVGQHTVYLKRVVGLPGDILRLSRGTLAINGTPVELRNKAGVIHYTPFRFGHYLRDDWDDMTVPAESYFVLGDHSADSADSRAWGCVPAKAVLGRAVFCYSPASRLGPLQ